MTLWSPLRLHDGGPCPVGEDERIAPIISDTVGQAIQIAQGPAGFVPWSMVIAYQVALPEPRDMQVPWHVIPKEYRWAARDERAFACVFAREPRRGNFAWYPMEGDYIRIDQLVGYDPGDKPWDQSPIERPEGV